MKNNMTPISQTIVDKHLKAHGVADIGKATIRQIVKIVSDIEQETGIPFIKMEMGVPGLPPPQVGIDAEIAALNNGVASLYPAIEGIAPLKNEIARFAKLFMNITVQPECCVPTVGSMQGGFASFLTACRRDENRSKLLFIDPGFPVQKTQMKILGLEYESFDVYKYRGEKLAEKLESYCKQNTISAFLYSNPNNPSWICFSEEELQIIADVARKYDIIVIEDLAYFGMDFRVDYSAPGKPPYQPTIANYYDNYILLVSASKIFSYAGQRIAALIISSDLFTRNFPDLAPYFSFTEFGKALIYGALYGLSSGTSHSSQHALYALLQAANNGTYNFVNDVKTYGKRAKIMKEMFIDAGFSVVYDTDIDRPIADGFYFTISYKNLLGSQLAQELLLYGISAITLDSTGSERLEGLRACTSQVRDSQLPILKERLSLFSKLHK
ncbi:MAG: pyridoxal phosphate-dependent aminotransferase [Bacteroidales bacterium]|nr:pyridoxal phosphate-dependent aminotransferase [Bacteroidales bacterium]